MTRQGEASNGLLEPSLPSSRKPLARLLVTTLVFSGLFGLGASKSAAEIGDAAFSRLVFGLQPPTNRRAERDVNLVEELLEAGRFGESAPLIDRRFAADEDHVDASGESLKRRLIRSLLRCEPRGLQVIRSVLNGEYERALANASTVGRLRRVVWRYPPEVFGEAALAALARAETDRGNYELAATTLQAARELALAEGDPAKAKGFARREAVHRLRIGQRHRTGALTIEEAAALSDATAATVSKQAEQRAPNAWLTAGGDAEHRAAAPGDIPLPWRSWRASIAAENSVDAVSDKATSAPQLPNVHAIAVNGIIVTPTRGGLVACSAATGKRIWTVRNSETDRSLSPSHGSLATDTRSVFALIESAPRLDPSGSGRDPFEIETFFQKSLKEPTKNCLAAYELATGGKLRWRLDGAETSGPAAGMRFLGAPAVMESRLYAIAERDQALLLVEIEARTGRIEGVQTLAHCERDPVASDDQPAITPTISDGIVYCPTGRGTVAAVEPLRRQLLWIAYLGVDKEESVSGQAAGWRGMGRVNHRQWSEGPQGWHHCRALVAEGRLVVASPAEASLQVFDAFTGGRLWQTPVERGFALGSVENGLVLAIESEVVSTWRLADGEPAWSIPLPDAETPAGEGLLLSGRYLLPLMSGRLAEIAFEGTDGATLELVDLATNRLTVAPKLGNLLYHNGAILSRSASTLESYSQRSRDPSAQETAVVAMAGGQTDSAIALLREAYASLPNDRRIAEQLAAALIRSIERDPARTAQVGEEVAKLVAGPQATAYAAMLRLRAADRSDTATIRREAQTLRTGRTATVVLQPENGLKLLASRLAEGPLRDNAPSESKPRASWSTTSDSRFDPEWSVRQVASQIDTTPKAATSTIKRRSRPDQTTKPRRLSIPLGPVVGNGPRYWTLESRGSGSPVLIGANARGERLFAEALPSDLASTGKQALATVGTPGHRYKNGWLAVKLDRGFVTYRLAGEGSDEAFPPEAGWAWTTDEGTAMAGPPELSASDASESPVAIGPWGVVSLAGTTLRCRDLATGAPQWRRDLSESLAGPVRVLSYANDLYVVGNDARGRRLSAWTGEQRPDNWSLPPAKRWRGQADGRLLVETRDVGGRRFQIVDITAPGTEGVLWERQVPSTTRFVLNDGLAAFLDEDLQLTVVDLAAATERFSVSLSGAAEPLVRAFRTTVRGDRLLVEVDRSNPMVDRARGESSLDSKPLLTGELHCLDANSGESLWAGPAEVDGMAVLELAATEVPALLLGHRKAPESEDEQAEANLGLVVLDLATGGTLYRNHTLPAGDERTSIASVGAQYEAQQESTASQRRLLIRAGRSWITLQTTDRPAPPRTPMIARIENPRPSDLKDMGRNVELFFKSLWDEEE